MNKWVRVVVGTFSGACAATVMFTPSSAVGAQAPQPETPTTATTTTQVATPSPTTTTSVAQTPPPGSSAPPRVTTPPTTTTPYPRVVERNCAEYPGDPQLADKLDAEKEDGSFHLVVLARYCGVLFDPEAKDQAPDAEVERPMSNLEYAVYKRNDPTFSGTYDDVTANRAQRKLVVEASDEKWYAEHEEDRPVPVTNGTQPPAPVTTRAAAEKTKDTKAAPATSVPSSSTSNPEADTEDGGGGGGQTIQIMGLALLGAGAFAWGVMGVRSDDSDDDKK